MAGTEPASGDRRSLGKAVGQGLALWVAGFLALAALVAGLVVLAWPAITVAVLLDTLVIGGLSLAAVDLVGAAVNHRHGDPRWWLPPRPYRGELDREVRRLS